MFTRVSWFFTFLGTIDERTRSLALDPLTTFCFFWTTCTCCWPPSFHFLRIGGTSPLVSLKFLSFWFVVIFSAHFLGIFFVGTVFGCVLRILGGLDAITSSFFFLVLFSFLSSSSSFFCCWTYHFVFLLLHDSIHHVGNSKLIQTSKHYLHQLRLWRHAFVVF